MLAVMNQINYLKHPEHFLVHCELSVNIPNYLLPSDDSCLFVCFLFFNIYKIEVFDCLVASRDLGLRLNTVGDKSKARKLCEMPKVPKSVTSHEPEAWPRGSQFSSV